MDGTLIKFILTITNVLERGRTNSIVYPPKINTSKVFLSKNSIQLNYFSCCTTTNY